MPLEPIVIEALKTSVKANNQPDAVLHRLLKWLNDLSDRPIHLISTEDREMHIVAILGAVEIENQNNLNNTEE